LITDLCVVPSETGFTVRHDRSKGPVRIEDEPALERVRSVYDDEEEETDYSLNAARGSRELRHAVDMKRRGIVAELTKTTYTHREVLTLYAESPVTAWEVEPLEEFPLVAILRDVRTSRIVDIEALGFGAKLTDMASEKPQTQVRRGQRRAVTGNPGYQHPQGGQGQYSTTCSGE